MIDFGGGMIFPDSYNRDQDDGPDICDWCEGSGEETLVFLSDEGSFERVITCVRCGGTGQVG